MFLSDDCPPLNTADDDGGLVSQAAAAVAGDDSSAYSVNDSQTSFHDVSCSG